MMIRLQIWILIVVGILMWANASDNEFDLLNSLDDEKNGGWLVILGLKKGTVVHQYSLMCLLVTQVNLTYFNVFTAIFVETEFDLFF